jgi:quercetin 2,3-dioxygenase
MHHTSVERSFAVQRASDRACFDRGWLKTCHSFSFADYHDPDNMNWGALRVFNDDRVAPGEGFPTHPHRDMEIITYVLTGRLEHRDSTGSHGIVGPGGVQFMSAGTGVQHSEFNHSKTQPLHFLQMWVVPGKLGSTPTYGQVEFAEADRLNRWLPVASGHPSVDAPIQLTADAAFLVTEIKEHAQVRHTFEPERLGFLFLAAGEAKAEALDDGDQIVGTESLSAGDAIRMSSIVRVVLHGKATAVLWDLPALP